MVLINWYRKDRLYRSVKIVGVELIIKGAALLAGQ